MDFLKNITKGMDYTHVLDEGKNSSEFTGSIDTGSYILNAAISSSLYGGVPNNKITVFAGESTTGKTFFVLGIIYTFLKENPTGGVIYFDTEAAVTKKMMEDRGIDPKRVVISEPDSIERFRSNATNILNGYAEQKDKPPLMMVLDSLGNISTNKEIGDISDEKDTKDMTRPGLLRGAFRVLALKCARAGVPLLVTNHVYDVIGCLDESQVVVMSDGTTKKIIDIAVGDMVKTQTGEKSVSALHEYDVDEYYEMVLEDGSVIKATPNHKFKTAKGEWKRIDELESGEDLAVLEV